MAFTSDRVQRGILWAGSGLLLLLVVGAGCSGASSPQQQTAQQVATQEVSANPTATAPANPGDGPTSGATTPLSEPPDGSLPAAAIGSAAEKTGALQTYRMNYELTDRVQEQVVTLFDGAYRGQDFQYTFKTDDIAYLGFDPKTGMHSIRIDGNNYFSGMYIMPEADPAIWYNFGTNPPPGLQDQHRTIAALLDKLLRDKVDLTDFTATGTETLHGQECRRYTTEQWDAFEALNQMGYAIRLTGLAGSVAAQELGVLVCADGYLHQLTGQIRGTSKDTPDDPGEPIDVEIVLQVSDINGAITIAAPADAMAPSR